MSHLPTASRILIVAPPGAGKTFALRRIGEAFRPGGEILDPLGEVGEIGWRWRRWTDWTRAPIQGEPEEERLIGMLTEMESGTALLVDEAARFVPNVTQPERSVVFAWLDVARNFGYSFALAEKYPSRMPPLVTDLVELVAFRPFRAPRARAWLRDAGLPDDLADPSGHGFYVAPAGEEVLGVFDANEIALSFVSVPLDKTGARRRIE